MIIRNNAKGPSFSTNQTSHDLSATLSQTRSFESARGERTAPNPEQFDLEVLYPNLFPVQSTSKPAAFATILAALHRWVTARQARAT
jgi:hypothetical protein